jgi:hypothetical protein
MLLDRAEVWLEAMCSDKIVYYDRELEVVLEMRSASAEYLEGEDLIERIVVLDLVQDLTQD